MIMYSAPAQSPALRTSHHRHTYFCLAFFRVFFRVGDRNHPRPMQFRTPIVMGNEAKIRIFWGSGGPPSRARGGAIGRATLIVTHFARPVYCYTG